MATTPQAILLDLYEKLQEAYSCNRLPSVEQTQELVDEVLQAARRLQEVKPPERRPRRKGGPADTPASVDPPNFPGPRKG